MKRLINWLLSKLPQPPEPKNNPRREFFRQLYASGKMVCVICKGEASYGTMKFPLCDSCFQSEFKGNREAYWHFVNIKFG